MLAKIQLAKLTKTISKNFHVPNNQYFKLTCHLQFFLFAKFDWLKNTKFDLVAQFNLPYSTCLIQLASFNFSLYYKICPAVAKYTGERSCLSVYAYMFICFYPSGCPVSIGC